MASPLSVFFSANGVVYGLIVPLIITHLLLLILIPSLLRNGSTVKGVAQAAYCFTMMTVGIILMTLGAIPTVLSVLGGYVFEGSVYVGLLLVFAFGGAVFLWHEQEVKAVDAASRAVPESVFFTIFRLIGRVLALLAALSLSLSIILHTTTEQGWWVTPFIMLVYGLLITWCTRTEKGTSLFSSSPMHLSSLRTSNGGVRKGAMKRAGQKG